MSLVYLTYHDENVIDLDEVNDIEKPERLKYTSKFKDAVRKQSHQRHMTQSGDGRKLLADSGKYDHRTMGFARTPLHAPSQFLRKQHGVKWIRVHDHVCPRESCLPPVPRLRSTNGRVQLASNNQNFNSNEKVRLNFIATNIEKVKQLQVKRPSLRFVDTANGDRQNLVNTGLLPQYVFNKNFGKVPHYLRTHKNVCQQFRPSRALEQSTLRDYKQNMSMYGVKKLSDEERATILEGLKVNFLEQSKIFQRLSLFTDTLAKKLRKARIENTLRQLEQDIYLMEKNPAIYVSNY